MPDKIETLQSSPVTKNLSDTGLHKIAAAFQKRSYASGETIGNTEASEVNQFAILARGTISVKIPHGVGESTVCILKPGDLVDANQNLGAANLYAEGDTQILRMSHEQFDGLVRAHPALMCHVIDGMVYNMRSILLRTNHLIAELKDFIYGSHNRS
ncbi:MAG: cyclic nucleotide-binding domain-containing protein [Gallionella sp.]